MLKIKTLLVSIPFKREGLSEHQKIPETDDYYYKVSIPFKREGLSELMINPYSPMVAK